MAGSPLLVMQPGYAPFIHTGSSNGAHKRRRRSTRQVHTDTFGLWAVSNGTMVVTAGATARVLHGPAAVFLTPDPERLIEIPAASDWLGLRFDIVDRPRQRLGGKKRAWHHTDGVAQPCPEELWGLVPPTVIPASLCNAAIQVLQDCCALWWLDDLAHYQANASLGHWLADYVVACRGPLDGQAAKRDLKSLCHELIIERLHQGVGVDDLAAATGYSPSRFAKRFYADTGIRPGAFIRSRRLAEAARRLAAHDESITIIADRCGYRSRAAFVRAFTRHFHCPPSEWRRRRR